MTTKITKQVIVIANEDEITTRCQEIIKRTEMNTSKFQLRDIIKLKSEDIKIKIETEKKVKKLKEVK